MTVPMALLALLDDGPAHGFVLKRRYDSVLGQERELRYGQVYATLSRLERDGFTSGVGVEQGEGAERKVYAITDDGVAELDRWLATPHEPGGRPTELFTKVILALVAGRPAEQILDAHRRSYLARMRELTAARRTGDVIDRLAGDHQIAHLEADLNWIEIAAARLGDLERTIGAEKEARR
ncbi:helix-turn-helix transcriptional regulator [Ruania alkalisoli]|uniref:Helix-turn-helix transcriptional regulator n=1 Tax=Ruania alkalisoli TaxID=2779775 RepID=A0A7M1STT3_9MICO|nr:PadR family transcriptional regulator [Ruania alkalisoli]QOR70935.1 helix-turn-helix transcriptional regulator [Ruania alkalisoli]